MARASRAAAACTPGPTTASPTRLEVGPGRTLHLDGRPWLIRGVTYSPTPLGYDPTTFSAGTDFHSTEFSAIHARDVELMEDMGVNAIRVYAVSATSSGRAFWDVLDAANISVFAGNVLYVPLGEASECTQEKNVLYLNTNYRRYVFTAHDNVEAGQWLGQLRDGIARAKRIAKERPKNKAKLAAATHSSNGESIAATHSGNRESLAATHSSNRASIAASNACHRASYTYWAAYGARWSLT